MTRHALTVLLWGMVHHMMVLAQASSGHRFGGKNDDPHGGVPMGIPNKFCDDGTRFTSIDWDPSSTAEYTCQDGGDSVLVEDSYESCERSAKRPTHVCYPQEIHYDEEIPTSGAHRPLWPQYGEYLYLPPQRWLHSLEHGAVVFLYNPCANQDEIELFKGIARNCMRRHIITPYKGIPRPKMFAVTSWKCKLVMTVPEVPKIVKFVREHALHSSEKSVYADGQYSLGLIHHAKMVSDKEESDICPQMLLMDQVGEDIMKQSRRRQSRLKQLWKVLEMNWKIEKLARI